MKKQASSNNGQDVQLRALEREAKAQRDLLESYLAKYREASARENIDAAPADGRIISRATVSNTPAYPKKLPIVLIATLATLLLTSGAIATGELLRMTAPRTAARFRRKLRAKLRLTVLTAPLPEPVRAAGDRARASERRSNQLDFRGSEPAETAMDALDGSAPEIGEIEQLADILVGAGAAARKVTVLGTASSDSITLTALTLARLMAQRGESRGRRSRRHPRRRWPRCRSIRSRPGLPN